MSENRELQDESMEQANGGLTLDQLKNHGMKDYAAFGTVVRKVEDNTIQDGTSYIVQTDDGAEIKAVFHQNHELSEGTRVALIMLMGGWIMEEIRCF